MEVLKKIWAYMVFVISVVFGTVLLINAYEMEAIYMAAFGSLVLSFFGATRE